MATQSQVVKKLAQAQFPFPFDISKYIDEALRVTTSLETALSYAQALIIQSKEFRQRFPGIFRRDGTLRLSPADYIDKQEQFVSVAAQYSVPLSLADFGKLVSRDVDPEEFRLRAKAMQTIRTNPETFKAFQRQIYAENLTRDKQGLPRIKPIKNVKDAMNFLLGGSDREVYDLYEAAEFRAGAASAGLKISESRASALARASEGVVSTEDVQKSFINIAQQLRSSGAELSAFGLTQRDLETIEFGGPDRAKKALTAAQALKQREAAGTPRARRQIGLGGGRPVVGEPGSPGI